MAMRSRSGVVRIRPSPSLSRASRKKAFLVARHHEPAVLGQGEAGRLALSKGCPQIGKGLEDRGVVKTNHLEVTRVDHSVDGRSLFGEQDLLEHVFGK
jgi:hypothetical protein